MFFTAELYEEPTVLALLTPSAIVLLIFRAFRVASFQQVCTQYSQRNEYTSKDGENQPKQKRNHKTMSDNVFDWYERFM